MIINLNTPTEKMLISTRTKKVLLWNDINNVEQLCALSISDLIKMESLGKKSVDDICKMLAANGLSLLCDFKSLDDYILGVNKLSFKDQFAQSALQGLLAFHGTINDRTLIVAAYDYAEMMMEERDARNR